MTNLVTLSNVTYKRNLKIIIDHLNLQLPQNNIIGLLGANGAGKTTLMRLISGVVPNYKGTIRIGTATTNTARKQVASFSQILTGVQPNARLTEIANYCDTLYSDFSIDVFEKIIASLDLDGTEKLSALSKGNRMKCVLAVTLARRVSLYLLDEPFDGIDSMTRKRLIKSMLTWKPDNATILISDHHVEDIANILDQVVILKHQMVISQKSAEEIREKDGLSIETYYENIYEGGVDHDQSHDNL